MDFKELRDTTPGLRNMTYLNSGWAGPSPQRVLDRMREAAERESELGPAGPEGQAYVRAIDEEARAAAGHMLNVNPGDLLLTHGTTEGVNIVLNGLSWEPGDVLLTAELEHPGIKTPATLLERRKGVSVERLVIPSNATPDQCIEAVRNALSPSVKLVALSHIMFTCGLRIPAEQIIREAHAADALVLLDGAQTAGQIAMDLKAMDVDYYASSGQKWLAGPTGSGSFYAHPDRRGLLTPSYTEPGLDFRTGFAMYSLASHGVMAKAGYAEAVHIHNELGGTAVETRTADLAAQLRAGLANIDGVRFSGPVEGPTASALTTIAVDGWEPPDLAEALWTHRRVVVRHVPYPPAIRLCTAACNDESDVETAIEAVRDLALKR